MDILCEYPTLVYRGVVLKRPSKYIKSPYVADVELEITNDMGEIERKEVLVHTASLGCCGMVEKGCYVWMISLEHVKNKERKCRYRVIYVETKTFPNTTINSNILNPLNNLLTNPVIRVGVEPKTAETIAHNALRNNYIDGLNVKSIAREKTLLNSRFDFMGKTQDNEYYILEVKNAPLAKYFDSTYETILPEKTSKTYWREKTAFFPDGYRKNKTETVSERAVKHIKELGEIKQKNKKIRCILLFVLQRSDISAFQPSRLDTIYLNEIRKAWLLGVEIKTLVVEWRENKAYFIRNKLPIYLFDTYDVIH